MRISRYLAALVGVALSASLMACSNHATNAVPGSAGNPASSLAQTPGLQFDAMDADLHADDDDSVLKHLDDLRTIGSTIDPINGDVNPYGLDIAKTDAGKLEAGDLVVCNFNDSANVQGTGTTIIALHPHPGATPLHIAQATALTGCTALALGSNDSIWAAAFATDKNPIFSPDGTLLTTLANGPFHGPLGRRSLRTPVRSESRRFMRATRARAASCASAFARMGPLTS